MAAATATPAATHVKWQPSEYAFNPYDLTAHRVCSDVDGKPAGSIAGGKGGSGTAPSKRRPGRQKRTSVLCQVPGCKSELVDAKKYHRRYRICVEHCNMAGLMIEGRRQRFCQQCGRFHDISEFEGAKRSCKRKLKQHNERRRSSMLGSSKKKWQSDSEVEEEVEEEEEDGEGLFEGESSEREGKKAGGSAKRRVPAGSGHHRAPPLQRQAEPPASGDSSAASHNTGAGGEVVRQLLAATTASPPAAPRQPHQVPVPHQQQAALAEHLVESHSASLDSSDSQRVAAAAAAAAGRQQPQGCHHRTSTPSQPSWLLTKQPSMPLSGKQPGMSDRLEKQEQLPHQQQQQQQQQQWAFQAELAGLAMAATTGGAPAGGACAYLAPAPATSAQLASSSGREVDLDAVLQQLLQDEDLQDLGLESMEMVLPQQPHGTGSGGLPVEPRKTAPVNGGMQTAAAGASHVWPEERFPSPYDLPIDLLEEMNMLPLLGAELAPGGAATAATAALTAGSAGSAGSAATSAPTQNMPAVSNMTLPLAKVADIVRQQDQWHAATAAALPQLQLLGCASSAFTAAAGSHHRAQQHQLAPAGVQPAMLASACSMLSVPGLTAGAHAAPLVGYASAQPSDHRLTRLCLKVFGCTPEGLLPAVRQELEDLLEVGASLLEGFIRPGCTQLTVNALMANERIQELRASGLTDVVHSLLSKCGNAEVLQRDMLVQYEGELAVVKKRRVVAVISLKHSPALVPALAPLLPLAVRAAADAPATAWLILRGRHMCDENDLVLARQQGKNLTVEMHACGAVQGGEYAKVRVLGLLPGFADLEVQHGTFISHPRALLVLPSQAAVDEVRQLERGAPGIDCVDDMLRDMGLLVQYLNRHELEAAGQPCPFYSPTLLACIAAKARRLVAAAVARGWAAVTEMLLPAVTADGKTAAEAVAAVDVCCPPGMTLLHVAVGTAAVPVVQQLAAWAAAVGHSWQVDARGSSGVTPLHVAALLPNCTAMRAVLAGMAPAVAKLWGLVQADDSTTPDTLAEAVHGAAAVGAGAACTAAAAAELLASAASGGSCHLSGDVALDQLAELAPAGETSGSCNAAALDRDVVDASDLSSSSQAETCPARIVEAAKSKGGGAEGEGGPSCCSNQRRRGRQAMKQHLGDMHITTILSEVEGGLEGGAARDPRPLSGALSGTVAAGAALLRALRYVAHQ